MIPIKFLVVYIFFTSLDEISHVNDQNLNILFLLNSNKPFDPLNNFGQSTMNTIKVFQSF